MILVTGADGIVGRAVCGALSCAQHEYLPVVRRRQWMTAENAYVTDLAKPGTLVGLARLPIEAIVHLAAAVPHSANYPDTKLSADLTRCMDRNVDSLQQQLGVPLVYMSTCGLYDRSSSAVKHEGDVSAIRIESPYYSAKFDGERLFASGSQTTILRLSAPVGPGLKRSVVLGRFIMAVRSGATLQVWGSGSREQNFIDARDVADLVTRVIAKPRNCTMNVAAHAPTTMADLAKIVVAVAGKGSIEYSGQIDPHEGETARYSVSRALELYGWLPTHDLVDSCRLLLDEGFEWQPSSVDESVRGA